MKTLIERTDATAIYEFFSGGNVRTVIYTKLDLNPEDENQEVTWNPEAMAETEHQAWLNWLEP